MRSQPLVWSECTSWKLSWVYFRFVLFFFFFHFGVKNEEEGPLQDLFRYTGLFKSKTFLWCTFTSVVFKQCHCITWLITLKWLALPLFLQWLHCVHSGVYFGIFSASFALLKYKCSATKGRLQKTEVRSLPTFWVCITASGWTWS